MADLFDAFHHTMSFENLPTSGVLSEGLPWVIHIMFIIFPPDICCLCSVFFSLEGIQFFIALGAKEGLCFCGEYLP